MDNIEISLLLDMWKYCHKGKNVTTELHFKIWNKCHVMVIYKSIFLLELLESYGEKILFKNIENKFEKQI